MSHFRCDFGNFLMFNKAIGESKTPEIKNSKRSYLIRIKMLQRFFYQNKRRAPNQREQYQ